MDRGEQAPDSPFRLASLTYIDANVAALAEARPHKLLVLEDPMPTGGIQACEAFRVGLLQHHDVVAEAVDHVLQICCFLNLCISRRVAIAFGQ